MTRVKEFFKRYIYAIIIYVLIFLVYKYVTDNGIANPYMFPTVDDIGEEFVRAGDTLFINLLHSFRLVFPSIAIALVIALGLGILLGMHPKLQAALSPVIYSFSVIPALLLSPFALLMAPSFKVASIFLIVYASIWATLFATITGIMTIDKSYLDKAATLEIKGLKKMFKVILPAASPSILSGFVSSLRSSFMVLVFAEMNGAKYGMGFFIKSNSEIGLYDKTWAGFLFMVVVLVIVMQTFEFAKKKMLKWTM